MQFRHTILLAAMLAATPQLFAQDVPPRKAPPPAQPQEPAADAEFQMPDPKHAEHEALKTLVGSWKYQMTMPAMPGVPGMEEAVEMRGIDRGELLCDGLWLKWTSEGTCGDAPFHGVWLVGYDPFAKGYKSVWVSSMDSTPSELDGRYDETTKTWSWRGNVPEGEMACTIAWTDADTMVESVVVTPPDGGEPHKMVITRERVKDVASAQGTEAATTRGGDAGAGLSAEERELLKVVGEWEAEVRHTMGPDAPAMESTATERVQAIGGGRFLWSDYNGTMMGAPFSGHGILGYDAAAGEYVSYWIDSMGATWARTRGKADEASGKLLLEGSCLCPMGTPMTIKQAVSWKDADTRVMQMEFVTEEGTGTMEFTYKRKRGKASKG